MSKTAVAYARFSSSNQREESIDEQLTRIEKYANDNDIRIIKTYADYAKSGSKKLELRDQFLLMFKEIEDGIIRPDYVVVYELSRFMRDRYESAIYKKKLKDCGVKLISATEMISDTPESIIMESILEGMNEYYSKHLAMEAMRGLMHNAQNCKSTGGTPPLGYDLDDEKRLVVNEYEKSIVQEIFDMFIEGYSYEEMATILNSKGYKTKRGRTFSRNSFCDMIENEKYIGTFVFNKSSSRDGRDKRNSHKLKNDDEIVRIENAFEPIISKEVFRKAQEVKKDRKRSGGRHKAKTNYLLSGIIYCGECKHPHDDKHYSFCGNNRVYQDGSKPDYVSYRCSNKGHCNNKEIRREYIEDYVLQELSNKIFNDKAIKFITRGINNKIQQLNKENLGRMDVAKKNIERIDKQISNILEAIKRGVYDESFEEELRRLREEKNVHSMNLDAQHVVVESINDVSEDSVRRSLEDFKAFIKSSNKEECKRFIKTFVDKVLVYRDYIEVYFKIDFNLGNVQLDFQDVCKIMREDIISTYSARKHNQDKVDYSKQYRLPYPARNIRLDTMGV